MSPLMLILKDFTLGVLVASILVCVVEPHLVWESHSSPLALCQVPVDVMTFQ